MAGRSIPDIYASCLNEMCKTFRAAHFYPGDHPALKRSVSRSHLYLKNLLRITSPLIFSVTKDGFIHDGKVVPVQAHVVKDLAYAVFRRRMKVVHFEAETTEHDLFRFYQVLQSDPDELERVGGPEKLLATFGVVHIWCNEVRFSRSDLPEDVGGDEEEEGTGGQKAQQIDPLQMLMQVSASEEARALLQRLAGAHDPKVFAPLLEELVKTTRNESVAASPNAAVPVVSILMSLAASRQEPIRGWSQQAIRALVSPPVLELLIIHMYQAVGSKWLSYRDIFFVLGEPSIPYLLRALVDNTNRKERLRTIECVIQFGQAALPLLEKMLHDERWFVVRNALYIMEEMKDKAPVKPVERLLYHGHEKVRRETAILLRSIGSRESFEALRAAVSQAEESDLRFLLPELAAFPTEWVESILLSYLKRGGMAIRVEAAEALAVLGSPKAMHELAEVFLKKGPVLNRDKQMLFRKAIGEKLLTFLPDTFAIFNQVRSDSSPAIKKLARQADDIMKKKAW